MLSLSLMLRGTFHMTLLSLFASSQAMVVEPRTLPPVAGTEPSPLAAGFFPNRLTMIQSLPKAHCFTNIPFTASILTPHFCLKSDTEAPTRASGAITEAGLVGSYERFGGDVAVTRANAAATKS